MVLQPQVGDSLSLGERVLDTTDAFLLSTAELKQRVGDDVELHNILDLVHFAHVDDYYVSCGGSDRGDGARSHGFLVGRIASC